MNEEQDGSGRLPLMSSTFERREHRKPQAEFLGHRIPAPKISPLFVQSE